MWSKHKPLSLLSPQSAPTQIMSKKSRPTKRAQKTESWEDRPTLWRVLGRRRARDGQFIHRRCFLGPSTSPSFAASLQHHPVVPQHPGAAGSVCGLSAAGQSVVRPGAAPHCLGVGLGLLISCGSCHAWPFDVTVCTLGTACLIPQFNSWRFWLVVFFKINFASTKFAKFFFDLLIYVYFVNYFELVIWMIMPSVNILSFISFHCWYLLTFLLTLQDAMGRAEVAIKAPFLAADIKKKTFFVLLLSVMFG